MGVANLELLKRAMERRDPAAHFPVAEQTINDRLRPLLTKPGEIRVEGAPLLSVLERGHRRKAGRRERVA